jgi:hypothetical protein
VTQPSGPALRVSASVGVVRVLLTVATFVAALGVPIAPIFAQNAPVTAVPYCPELKELNNYEMSSQRFAPIIGPARTGNYRDTRLPLPGWTNCAFYGNTTYTCDSVELKSRAEAVAVQQRIAREILDCFAGTWAEAPEQAGPDFVVLHPKLGPTSVTLNLDETNTKGHIVRLIIFLRR